MNPKAGGAERTIYEVCSRLSNKGYKITLLTAGWKDCRHHDNIKGIDIYRYRSNIAPHFFLPGFIIGQKPDVIVSDLGHAVPWPTASIKGKKNIVFFRHLHARSLPGQVSMPLAKIITAIEKIYFLIYPNSTFVTESTTSHLDLVSLGIKQSRIEVIPPGVDGKVFLPHEKTEYPSIVYFGGMRRYKRPEESLYLLQSLLPQIPDIKLFMVGSGPVESQLRKLSIDLGVQNSVIFTGRIAQMELSKIVASSWINIHTSVTEGWGLSIIEASSSGTPTVAYSVPGVVDTIEDHVNGIKVRDGDRTALLNAAISILRDPEKWWSSSTKVARKYNWDNTAKLWEKIILDSLKHK
jgi:glycosyltransferase involved in cell wall biosynthesis